eukprot:SM000080S22915  [mRNA]  locus=s80:70020:70277:- [translate_table: standard]
MGIEKELVRAGTGPYPRKGQKVTVHCTGYGGLTATRSLVALACAALFSSQAFFLSQRAGHNLALILTRGLKASVAQRYYRVSVKV